MACLILKLNLKFKPLKLVSSYKKLQDFVLFG